MIHEPMPTDAPSALHKMEKPYLRRGDTIWVDGSPAKVVAVLPDGGLKELRDDQPRMK